MRATLIIALSLSCAPAVLANDSLLVKRHCFSFSPIDVCIGTLSANYEFMAGRNGFLVEGHYSIPLIQEFRGGTAAYRYHFTKSALGQFIGPYVLAGELAAELQLPREPAYRYTYSYASAGLAWGTRGSLWKKYRLFYTFRIGVGYPFKSSLAWDEQPPATIGGIPLSTYEKITKIPSVIDSELNVSLVF